MHEVERVHDLLERAIAAATVVHARFIGLEAHGEHDVAQALDVPAEDVVYEACVGEDVEEAVVVLLGQLQHVTLADQRLPSREHEQVRTEVLGLAHQAVHFVEGQVQAVPVVCGPAAHAVLVAGARGIEEDDPGNVALLPLGVGRGGAQSTERGLVAPVQYGGLEHVRIGLVDDPEQVLLPLGPRVEPLLDATRGPGGGVLQQLACHIDQVADVLLTVIARGALDDLVEDHPERLAFGRVRDLGLHSDTPLLMKPCFDPVSKLSLLYPFGRTSGRLFDLFLKRA